ncbi:MAG TPA: helix-turn-helix transcriptional regulator [Pirellulales bacterium]|nr:helix-turn-helix transcriptional regulator [Pirellulales bacterium]
MIDPSAVQTVTLTGERFVILPEAEYLRLLGEQAGPELPGPDAQGRYPAVEAARVVLARKLIRARRALGWSQAELARRADVRVETLNRLEHGKHSPNVATVDKLSRALRAGEAKQAKAARGKEKASKVK